MKIRMTAALLAATLAPAFAAAPAPVPSAPILKLANAVIVGTNTNDLSAFAGLYATDGVVVDENPPFVWRGAGAGAAWWRSVQSITQKMKLTHLKAVNVRVGEFKQSATDAYLVEPMTVTGIFSDGKMLAESGTQTYTFHKGVAGWLISTQVWTTKP